MNLLTFMHVVAGSAALAGGAAALILRKGGRRHGQVGTLFFAAMLLMAGSGAILAALKPERGTAAIGIFTCYLVATAWASARRRDGRAGRFELSAFVVALGCSAAMATFAVQAAASSTGRLDSLPAAAHYPFAVIAGFAAALDLSFLIRGQLTRRQRIARHLWRMCAALAIAAFSFFLGQQDEFPEAWQGLFIWFLPPLGALAAMVFWILRVRFAKAWQSPGQRGDARTIVPALAAEQA